MLLPTVLYCPHETKKAHERFLSLYLYQLLDGMISTIKSFNESDTINPQATPFSFSWCWGREGCNGANQLVYWINHDQPAASGQQMSPYMFPFHLFVSFFSTSFFVLHFRLRETVVYKVSLREAREVLWRHLLATCKKESCTSRPRPIGTNTSTGATSSAEATSLYIIRSTYYTPATPIHWKRQKWRTKKNKNKSESKGRSRRGPFPPWLRSGLYSGRQPLWIPSMMADLVGRTAL